MAITPEGRALTEAQRLAQLKLNKEALRDVLAVWPLLDKEDLRGSFPEYLRALSVLLNNRNRRSAAIARAYYRAFRKVEGAEGEVPEVAEAGTIAPEQLLILARLMGPITIAKTGDADTALTKTLGMATRLILLGGRETVREAVKKDDSALGIARVTDGAPCFFCAMLASRGADYKAGSFAASNAKFEGKGNSKVHDHCGCSMEPIFRGKYELPPGSKKYEDLWKTSTSGKSGKAAVKAFRDAYTAQA